jgi:hypothetical protein
LRFKSPLPKLLSTFVNPTSIMASRYDTTELEDGTSDKTTMTTLKMSQIESDLESSTPVPAHTPTPSLSSDKVTFIRQKGRFNPLKQRRLKNSLLAGVGFLELANAGDFAANVWNEIPVPHFAAALWPLALLSRSRSPISPLGMLN